MFEIIKCKLTSTPVLYMPDSEAQFVVEVDVSDTGVGAILSQHAGPRVAPMCIILLSAHLTGEKLQCKGPRTSGSEADCNLGRP